MKRDEWAEAMEQEAASVNRVDATWAAQTHRQAQWRKQRGFLVMFVTLAAFQQGLTHPDLASILAGVFGAGWGLSIRGTSARLVVLGGAAYIVTTWLVFLLLRGLQVSTEMPALGLWPSLALLGLAFVGSCLGHLTRYVAGRIKEAWL